MEFHPPTLKILLYHISPVTIMPPGMIPLLDIVYLQDQYLSIIRNHIH